MAVMGLLRTLLDVLVALLVLALLLGMALAPWLAEAPDDESTICPREL